MSDHNPGGAGASLFPIILTLFFGVGFLAFMILVSGGFFVWVVAAVLAMASVGGLHYLLWGQALTREVAAEKAALEARERLEEYDFPRDRPSPDPHRHGIRER